MKKKSQQTREKKPVQRGLTKTGRKKATPLISESLEPTLADRPVTEKDKITPGQLLVLQRAIGNKAVGRLIQERRRPAVRQPREGELAIPAEKVGQAGLIQRGKIKLLNESSGKLPPGSKKPKLKQLTEDRFKR